MRQVSNKGRRFIEIAEAPGGVPVLVAYLDDAGVPTIGFGSTRGVYLGMTITEEEAHERMRSDLGDAERAVERLVKVELTQDQFDALVSFVFNVGVGAFAESTLLRLLNQGRYDLVDDQMLRWVFLTKAGKKVTSKGLKNRRMREAALWNESLTHAEIEAATEVKLSRSMPDTPPPRDKLMQTSTGKAQATALTAGAAGAAVEAANKTGATDFLRDQASSFGEMSQYLDFAKYIFVVLTLAAIAFTMWERVKKLREGE